LQGAAFRLLSREKVVLALLDRRGGVITGLGEGIDGFGGEITSEKT